MRYIKPDYFDEFQCTADKCPDTCCAGWQIMIDEESLEKYGEDKSAFCGRLHRGIDWQEGSFAQYGRRCSMLNDNNLCDLVIAKGEDWLCETCSRYPRHVEEFEGLREWSLSLSCPVAAEIILNRKTPVSFCVEEDEEEDPLEEEFEDFDFLLFTQLEDARKVIFDIVQNRKLPIERRKHIILKLAEEMQACVDGDRLFDMDELIQGYACWGGTKLHCCETEPVNGGTEPHCWGTELCNGGAEADGAVAKPSSRIVSGEERFENLCKGFSYLEQLERLREEWTEVLTETKETLYSGGYQHYREIYEAFDREFGAGGSRREEWEIYQENLLLFFLYTYFCGAVYDDWIYSKAAFCILSASFIQEFIMCRWFLADKYIDMQDCVELAYRYAREVEHSDENLNFLEECLSGETT